jgi:hypothetical protein
MKTSLTVLPESSAGSPALQTRSRQSALNLSYNDFLRLLGTPEWKRMKNLSMSGVLKRDGGAQLTVQVKLQRGYFEVLAVLERGHSATPDADWARLQLRLSEHGVRMAPLVSGSDRASWYAAGRFPAADRKLDGPSLRSLPAAIAPAQTRKSGALSLCAALATADRPS